MQSPLKQLVTFTSQTAGLEKTLRLIQAVSQIVGVASDDKTLSTQCLAARDRLALGCTHHRSSIQKSRTNLRQAVATSVSWTSTAVLNASMSCLPPLPRQGLYWPLWSWRSLPSWACICFLRTLQLYSLSLSHFPLSVIDRN